MWGIFVIDMKIVSWAEIWNEIWVVMRFYHNSWTFLSCFIMDVMFWKANAFGSEKDYANAFLFFHFLHPDRLPCLCVCTQGGTCLITKSLDFPVSTLSNSSQRPFAITMTEPSVQTEISIPLALLFSSLSK